MKIGSPVDVRFTAFKYRSTALVAGTACRVSADRLQDRTSGQPYFEALIEADAESLGAGS